MKDKQEQIEKMAKCMGEKIFFVQMIAKIAFKFRANVNW